MRYLSVCSGIEAASVAWHPLGWTPVAFSEIEPFPSAVLAHHYPNVPNYGDMTKFEEWPIEPGTVDLLVGGTPCQSFSVAGLRKGISDPRGGLMLTYLEIAQRLRPRWIVWENVPGVLSSGGGRDFGAFLGALAELRYGFAYRVLDAQYCRVDGRWPKAVPQRRRRVFVVGCDLERDPRGRERAAEVLALGTGLRWHLAESGKTREGVAADAEAGVARCVTTGEGKRQDWETCTIIPQPVPSDLFQITAPVNRQNRKPGDPCHTLARDNAAHAAVVNMQGSKSNACVSTDGSSFTLNAMHGHDVHAVAFNWQNGGGYGNANEGLGITIEGTGPIQRCNTPAVAHAVDLYNQSIDGDCAATLTEACGGTNTSGPKVMAFKPGQSAEARSLGAQVDVACTLEAGGGGNNKQAVAHAIAPTITAANDPSRSPQSSEVTQQVAAVHAASMTVRRLTPRECERLQGFPDDYTAIPWRGKAADECPDGPRYKALGNSMAVNCMAWIGERIAAVDSRHDI